MKNDPRSYDRNFCNCVKKPEKNSVLNFFFRLLYAIVKIAIITARIILHLISYPQFTYDFFHMHHSESIKSTFQTWGLVEWQFPLTENTLVRASDPPQYVNKRQFWIQRIHRSYMLRLATTSLDTLYCADPKTMNTLIWFWHFLFCSNQSEATWNHKLITVTVCSLVFSRIIGFYLKHNNFHKYFWCSRFSDSPSKLLNCEEIARRPSTTFRVQKCL